jgi:hypothetical protein
MVARSPDKELQVGQVMLFLNEAQKIGWNETVAFTRLKEYARQQKWGVLPSITMNTVAQRVRCGNCHALNDKQQNFCTNCQRALYAECPNCSQRVLSDAIHCGNCGFSVGDRLWIETSLEQCQELLSKNNLREAQKILKRVEDVWRPQRPDALVRKIEECKVLAQRVKQELKQKELHLTQLIDKRLLYEARQYLQNNSADIPDGEMHRQLIETGLSHAQEALRRARTVGISQDERREHCIQALQLCADFKEARTLLQTLPPAPPDRLQAHVHGDIVSLSWAPSPTRNAVYTIVRKAQFQPTALGDGEEIARVSSQMYDDKQPLIGSPLYYGVFAVCEEVPSTQGALLATPVLLVHDVTQEGATISDNRIDLFWRLPPHVHSVVVVRKEQTPPTSLRDGIQIPVSDAKRSSVIDRNVQNERLYYYGIYCQFKDANGQLVSSQGKIVSAKPEMPPTPISDLYINGTRTTQGHEITLRWQPPKKGVGVILKSAQSLGLKEGSVLPETHLRTLGQLLEDRPDSVIDVWNKHGIAHYVPVVLFQRMAYIGAEQRYVAVEDVSNLTRRVFNTRIHLTWSWPQNCQEVQITVVAIDPSSVPEDATVASSLQNSGAASMIRLGLAEYNRAGGYYEVNGIVNHTYHIIVAALVKQGNELIAAPGQSVSAMLMNILEITYYIKNPSTFRKKRTLHIHPLNSGYLPPILLVCKQQVLPFNKHDGEIMGSWGMQQVSANKQLELELPLKVYPPNTVCKLFLEDDAHYDCVKVSLPLETKLRIQ